MLLSELALIFFFFFSLNIVTKEGHLFLFIFKWRNVKNLGMQTQMKLQCLSKCQQKCLESDELPCGMSLFKKSCQFIFLFLLADRGICSHWLGVLPISSSRYCRAGVHRCQRRPVWGLLRDCNDRPRGGHPGGERMRRCFGRSFCSLMSQRMHLFWCPHSCPQSSLQIKMSWKSRSFQVERAPFWLRGSWKISRNSSTFILSGEILFPVAECASLVALPQGWSFHSTWCDRV